MKATGSILYADDRLLVINKPPGISLATRVQEPGVAAQRLLSSLPEQEMEEAGLAGQFFWLVHRLDLGTSGIVLLARDAEMHGTLSSLFGSRSIAKTYLALVWGHPRPCAGIYDAPLGPDTRDRRRMKAVLSGRPAVTRYRTLARAPHVALLQLFPETGRTHQIRVHLSHAGHWIVGDDLYGGERQRGIRDAHLRMVLSPPHLLLHAWRLELPEGTGTGATHFQAPLPETFAQTLNSLGMNESLPEEWNRTEAER
jgi:23S rRNA pseudouridine1911/1915/1917 synthase